MSSSRWHSGIATWFAEIRRSSIAAGLSAPMVRRAAVFLGIVVVPVALFLWSWLFRFNDPDGNVSGLLDDHYYYLLRGWQMLYGDLPDRDFVDIGAPLTFALAAATQLWVGRGAWSEMVFCVSALSLATVLTYFVARRASGSIVIAVVAAVFQASLQPRLYSYGKLVVYAAAIPVLWAFIDKPTRGRRFALAAITAVALLLRHDHGVYVGVGMAIAIVMLPEVAWRERVRHAVVYGLLVLTLLSPYLWFLQRQGGIVTHFVTANSWSQRDRERAPLVLPAMMFSGPGGEVASEGADWWDRGVFVAAKRHHVPWIFWLVIVLPMLTLAALPLWNGSWRREWPNARRKVALVAVLGLILDWAFLRGNLEARFGDVSVTSAILGACLFSAGWAVVSGRFGRADSGRTPRPLTRLAAGTLVATLVGLTVFVEIPSFRHRMEGAHLLDRTELWKERFHDVRQKGETWPLERWATPDEPGLMRLVFYIRDCTAPTDRVFMSEYYPQVLALAKRPFAAGFGDLRLGFFETPEDQRLAVSRLARQRVPLAVMPAADGFGRFKDHFPIVDAYFTEHLRSAGEYDIGNGIRIHLLASRDIPQTGTWGPSDWPCYR